jgi:transposase InsO family protein
MLVDPVSALQLPLFASHSPAYQEALAYYEEIRPIVKRERTLAQQSRATGLNYWRLWRHLRRFTRSGILGLIDRRKLPHPWGKTSIEELLPRHIQQHLVQLAIAHAFTDRELARIVRDCYHVSVDHRGVRRVLDWHHLSPDVLQSRRQKAQRAPLPAPPLDRPLTLPLEPTTLAQRLAQALSPEHVLLRFRTYREYPTEEQARWRIIELLQVGFRPRRVATLLAIQPPVVYHWKRRFDALGLLGLTTHTRASTPITTRVPVQAMMEVFQLLDNNPLLGHYRVKMALDSLGYRYGHTTVWQMVALYKQAHLPSLREKRSPNPDEQPQQATTPHQVWFADIRYLVTIDGRWLYSVLIFDGYSRAMVGAGCFDRQNFAQLVQVLRQAIAQWGAPEAVVSDHGAVFVALQPCLAQLAIQWAPITKGHPWQNLAEGGFSIQRRMLDAYVVRCTDRAEVYRQHAQFVQDYQFWGHWAHKRTDDRGRLYSVSPEVVLGNAKGRMVEASRLRRIFRLRQLTRQVRQQGQIRLHNFGLYVDQVLWGQTVAVLVYDEALRIEQADQLLVSYPCIYDTTQRRITAVAEQGRQQYHSFPVIQLMLWALEIVHAVWRMPPYRWSQRPRRGLRTRQLTLFDGFAQ